MVNALMIGAGEYTTGCVFTASGPASDKPAGVIGITFIDMRRRGKVRSTHQLSGAHRSVTRTTYAQNVNCPSEGPFRFPWVGERSAGYAATWFHATLWTQVNKLVLADACGTKLPIIRETMQKKVVWHRYKIALLETAVRASENS
eukprot:1174473-Prorocentrum_minimum.AAC.2